MATPTQIKRRGRLSLLLGTLVAAIAFAAVAYADDISNNLDASVDAVAEVMPLNVGGANGTTQLYVTPRNDDGKPGCNLTGSTTLVLSVSSSNTGVATVSPSSVTFGACGDTRTLTVTPQGQGSATISVSQTSNNTGGTFNLAPATFTVNVTGPANTAPSVSVAGVTGGASYSKGSVPAATCEVTDAEDGNSSFAATLSAVTGPYAPDGIGQQTASCSYTDGGGLTASASETYGIVDPSAPTIGSTLDPASPDGNNGWYKGNVSLTWNVGEPESPNSLQKTGCVDQSITADQAETTYSCEATSAGGSAGPVSVSIKRDGAKPTIAGSASPAPNGAGWNNTNVAVSFTCADSLSGVDSCGPNQTLSSEGAGQSATGTATDLAGNSETATVSGINIDKSAPSVAYTSASPAANAAGWHNTDVVATFTATDSLSGFAGPSATATGTTTTSGEGSAVTVGSPAFTDLAGNEAAAGAATSPAFKIDKTSPSVSLTGVAQGGTYPLGAVPAAGCSTSDSLSGVKTAATASTSGGPVGAITATCSGATDNADNTRAPVSVTYTVVYPWAGFFQPVDMGGLNKAKAGSTIPVKFNLGGDQGLNVFAASSPSVSAPFACNATGADAIEEYAPLGTTSGLKYDPLADQYVYNWKTDPKWSGTCRQLRVKLVDGTVHTADFNFFK